MFSWPYSKYILSFFFFFCRIDNWKREHIRQFLREKVKSGASASEWFSGTVSFTPLIVVGLCHIFHTFISWMIWKLNDGMKLGYSIRLFPVFLVVDLFLTVGWLYFYEMCYAWGAPFSSQCCDFCWSIHWIVFLGFPYCRSTILQTSIHIDWMVSWCLFHFHENEYKLQKYWIRACRVILSH